MTDRAARVGAHLAEVDARLARSRYDDRARPPAVVAERPAWAVVPSEVDTDVHLHPSVTLRLAAAPLDLEQVAVVVSAALGVDLDDARRRWGANLRHVDGGSVLVAERYGNVIGAALLVLTEDAHGTVAGVHLLVVAPRLRRRGTGRALLARCVELAAAAGADLVVLAPPPLAAEPHDGGPGTPTPPPAG